MSEKEKKHKRLSAKSLLSRSLSEKGRSKSQTNSPRALDSGDESSTQSEPNTPRKSSSSSVVLLEELNKLSVPRSSTNQTTTPTTTAATTTTRPVRNHDDLGDRVTELETQMTMVNQVVLGDRQIFQENNEILKRLEKKGNSCCNVL